LHEQLVMERQALMAQLDTYKPRVVLNADTPAHTLIELINELIDGSKQTVRSHEELQHMRSVLLRGIDVYQPDDLACKLAAASMETDVGESLANLLGPRSNASNCLTHAIARYSSAGGMTGEASHGMCGFITASDGLAASQTNNVGLTETFLTNPVERLLAAVDDWDFDVMELQQESQV
jgi:hypothetical protein